MTVLGEVDFDADGVLHGWCWDPRRPDDRLTIDLMVDEQVVATLVASRFREDLRDRKIGDGYHGFSATLTRHIGQNSTATMIRACEHNFGTCFWQFVLREFSLPNDFDSRVDFARAEIAALARAPALEPKMSRTTRLTSTMAALGAHLRAGIAPPPPPAAFTLPSPAHPSLSVILDASTGGPALFDDLRAAAAWLNPDAEFLLTDDGADPATLAAQRQARNLNYILLPGIPAAALRNRAVQSARGSILLFLDHAQGRLAAALPKILAAAAGQLVISPVLADAVARMLPVYAPNMTETQRSIRCGLTLAGPAPLIASLGFDAAMDDGAGLDILDLALRAAVRGIPLTVWCGAESQRRRPGDAAAGRRFAEYWMRERV